MLHHNGIFNLLLIIVFFACSSQKPAENIPPKRDLRGVWIASVANIDWPSKKGLSTQSQQDEFVSIVDRHQKQGINAVFVQVRAASDAFYSAGREPWSEWLTGTQGKAPVPYYDPLSFMIDHAHERNMEFHAWLNLNRGTHAASGKITTGHITKEKPEWFIVYGGTKVYNFGLPEVRRYLVSLVLDIVKNYDIDGIHFDDYFYPYPISGQKIRDQDTFRAYSRGFTKIEDWRRDNINLLVKAIADAIHEEKPYVKFGISPFGVWRSLERDSQGSDTNGALSSYDDLYADSRLWMQKGWIDYVIPQIYFATENRRVPYKETVDWWVKNKGRGHIYIGMAAYRVGEKNKEWGSATQISKQLEINETTQGVSGSVFFSSKSLLSTTNGIDQILKNTFHYPALPPVMDWKPADNLPKPEVTELMWNKEGSKIRIKWQIPDNSEEFVRSFVIYRFIKGEKRTLDNPRNIVAIIRNSEVKEFIDTTVVANTAYEYAVTALDRLWNESTPSKLHKLY